MTPPIRPERPQVTGVIDKVRKAQQAGYSMEEITAFLEQSGHAPYAQTLRDAKQGSAGMDGVQAAQGAFSGFGDEVMAAGGTLASKVIGDKRPWGEVYTTLRDDVRSKQRINQEANPIRAGVAQVAGALAAGKAVRIPNAQIPGTLTSSAAGRAVNSAATGAIQGAVSGYGSADTDRWEGAAIGAGFGAAGGALFSAGADVIRKGLGMARSVMTNVGAQHASQAAALPAGTGAGTAMTTAQQGPSVLDRIRASTGRSVAATPRQPAPDAGARRAIQRLDRQGMTTKQLAEQSAEADGPDILGEVMGERGIRDTRTARMLGHQAPDQIETALTDRARGEVGRVRNALEREVGPHVDDVAFANERLQAGRTASRPLYAEFEAIGPLKTPEMRDALKGLNTATRTLGIGANVFDKVRAVALEEGDKLPKTLFDENGKLRKALTAKQVDYVKKALDEVVSAGDMAEKTGMMQPGTFTGSQLRVIRNARDRMVEAADAATNGKYKAARDAYAGPVQERAAFLRGQQAKGITQPDVPRLLNDPQAPSFARGVGNKLLDDLGALGDGAAGPVRNPAPTVMGSENARARLAVATQNDAGKIASVEHAATNAARRLRTRGIVTGGSQTAEKLADGVEAAADPTMIQQLMSGKAGGALVSLATKGYVGAGRKMVGEEMDDYSRYLLAGAPGQMTREEATRRLAAMEPALRAQWAQQVLARGRTAGTVAGATFGPRR